MAVPTERTTIRRHPERADYDDGTIAAILDEAVVAHVGFAAEGRPSVIPMVYARRGPTLYLHGSAASGLLRTARRGVPVCVTVTLLDGFVLARSAFRHSVNYRSVVVFGEAREVTDPAEKRAALLALVDHAVPGRAGEARPPNDRETAATLVLALPLTKASAKIRTGPPLDDETDLDHPVWAGVLPLSTSIGEPEPAEGVDPSRLAPFRPSRPGRPDQA